MTRFAGLAAVLVLLPGCVLSEHPLSDMTKAEPDDRLLGTWESTEKPAAEPLVIDVPAVKGNPKGLMRATHPGRPDKNGVWFFVTKVGKQSYANVMFDKTEKGGADLHREGDFEKWKVARATRFLVMWYAVDGDVLTVNFGDEKPHAAAVKAAGFESRGEFAQSPPGWLEKYHTDKGYEGFYPKKLAQTYRKVKKKER